jgi:hypothetical protein
MGNMLPLPVFTFKIQMHLYLLASQMPYFRFENAVLAHLTGKTLETKGRSMH